MKLEEYLKREDEYKEIYWKEDVKRIVRVMEKRNIEITPKEAENLWNWHSDNCFAQWLGLPESDDELFKLIIEDARIKYGFNDEE